MALINEVYIGNRALQKLGVSSFIQSLTENSKEAKNISVAFDTARQQALSSFDWNFARKRQVLASHSEAPPDGVWAYRYQYPVDCLEARELQNPFGWASDAVPFEVEANAAGTQKTILTDMEDAILVYTFDQMNYDLYPSYFVEMVATLLAYHIAYPITGKQSDAEKMLQAYLNIQARTPSINANERVGRGPRDASWIRARGAGIQKGTIFDQGE